MSYNGTILVPEYSVYPGYASNRYSLLFELIAQRNNFKVMATSSFKKEQQEGKICIAFKTLQHNDIHQNEEVLLLDGSINIIFYQIRKKKTQCFSFGMNFFRKKYMDF
jgi:hypothetical protein